MGLVVGFECGKRCCCVPNRDMDLDHSLGVLSLGTLVDLEITSKNAHANPTQLDVEPQEALQGTPRTKSPFGCGSFVLLGIAKYGLQAFCSGSVSSPTSKIPCMPSKAAESRHIGTLGAASCWRLDFQLPFQDGL